MIKAKSLLINLDRFEGQYKMDKKHGYGVYQWAEVKYKYRVNRIIIIDKFLLIFQLLHFNLNYFTKENFKFKID